MTTSSVPLQALCLDCRQPRPAHYETRTGGVFLKRQCQSCGETEALVTRDVSLFETVREVASSGAKGERGLIVELLDGCNIECPTCIAGSGLLAGNVRPAKDLKSRMSEVVSNRLFRAVLLSGGEPTIHPQFLDLCSYVAALDVPAKVLITNGLRFAREPKLLSSFAESGGTEMEVFLQFDSLRPSALIDIRGADFSRERMAALNGLAEHDISVTLVNVVKRGVTLDHVGEVLEVARSMPNVVGVQFQPIRDAGRVKHFSWALNSCDVADIFDAFPGAVRLAPCLSSPWSTYLGMMDRDSGSISSGSSDDYYIPPTNTTPKGKIRVAVLDYSDRYNWTTERSRTAALEVLTPFGVTPSVDDYFLDLS